MRGEHGVQQAIRDFLAAALPEDCFWSGIDHANAKDALTGALRKARGVRAGLPDFILCYRGLFYGIEVKSASGRPSAAQIGVAAGIRRAGGTYVVVRSTAEVEAVLRDWGFPLHATHLPLAGGSARRRLRAAA
jgi:hypothetical protein